MGAKIQIKGTEEKTDIPRGSAIPREGETLIIISRGDRVEKLYQIYTIEHTLDLNNRMGIINTLITIEEIKNDVDEDDEEDFEDIATKIDEEE